MQKPSKPAYSYAKDQFDKMKQKLNYGGLIILVALITIITVSTLLMIADKPGIYLVKIDNKTIGYINDIDTYNEAINNVKMLNKGDFTTDVAAEKTESKDNNIKPITGSDIEEALKDRLGLKCYVISANGVELAAVKNLRDYQNVANGIIKYYYPKDKDSKITITSGKIVEKLTVHQFDGTRNDILSASDAIKKIINGRGASKTYKIKDGDTIWDIAIANNVEVEDIQAANPKLNLDKIKIGQVIKLAVNEPYINVRIAAKIDSVEKIPYDTKTVSDKKIRRGSKKVKRLGHYGLTRIAKNVVINNGDIISENVTSTKILKNPINAIIAVGARSEIFAATGIFMKPSRGMLSSPFGRRWGKMHEGIDLAGPTGSPIDAADSGKISFVGRRSGYGLCVMISHGKGLQTLYGHTSKTFVRVGQYVKKGQRIASVGSTGHSTGPHLHFEVRKNGQPVNPLRYLRLR